MLNRNGISQSKLSREQYALKESIFAQYDTRAHENTSSDSDLGCYKLFPKEIDLPLLMLRTIELIFAQADVYRHLKPQPHLTLFKDKSVLISKYLDEDQITSSHILSCLST